MPSGYEATYSKSAQKRWQLLYTARSCCMFRLTSHRCYQVRKLCRAPFVTSELNYDHLCPQRLKCLSSHHTRPWLVQMNTVVGRWFTTVIEFSFLPATFLRLLCTAKIVFADGTFRTAPHIFQQLFTVNFMYNGKLLPAVYALTKRKTQSIYELILRAIHNAAEEHNLAFQPTHFFDRFWSWVYVCDWCSVAGHASAGLLFSYLSVLLPPCPVLGTATNIQNKQCTSHFATSLHGISFLAGGTDCSNLPISLLIQFDGMWQFFRPLWNTSAVNGQKPCRQQCGVFTGMLCVPITIWKVGTSQWKEILGRITSTFIAF